MAHGLEYNRQEVIQPFIFQHKNMGDVVQFKRPKVSQRHKGNTLCRSGFHQWQVLKEKQFDVKQGKLVTVYQCRRCAKTKSKAL